MAEDWENEEIEDSELYDQAPSAWKVRMLVLGGVVGALAGVIGAYLLVQRAAEQQDRPKLTAGEGVKLGVLVLGLLRQVSTLGEK